MALSDGVNLFSGDSNLCQVVTNADLFPPAATAACSPKHLLLWQWDFNVSFPDVCLANSHMPFKTSLPWSANPVLEPVVAATTFLGTPPAPAVATVCQRPVCLLPLSPDSELLEAMYYSFLSPGLAPPKINGHRNGVIRVLLPVAYQGQPSERTRVSLVLQGWGSS